jgi:large subunit ribosomal protein L37Ae
MAKKADLGPAKRFGARYGKAIKERVAKIERIQRSRQKCTVCNKNSAKQISRGIFSCRSCGAKFTGRAYAVSQ